MDRLQRNGGMAGIIAGIALAVGYALFMSSGLTPQVAMDPTAALPIVSQQGARWTLMSLGFALASILGVLVFAALAARFREKAPTRARAVLYIGLIGLTGYALATFAFWHGATGLAQYAAKDKTAAEHAWVALSAIGAAFDSVGSAGTGAAILLAGWAMIETGMLGAALGWVGVVAGALGLLSALGVQHPVVFLGGVVLMVIWLVWTGAMLRKE
jgi:hypothetical protein